MDGKGTISDYRSRMDKTLASPDLTNFEKLQTLVRNQILQSSNSQFEEYIENVVERRSKEVSNFLSMLRSTTLVNDAERSKSSMDLHGVWKVKQDTDEFRVMYREGPDGTPFHTLLVEGYVDGPLDVCLCISWESSLYNKWWPQTAIPTFKIISSRCLQRVGAGEQISLVRMKVSWPLSSREALIHYFAFEYFHDDLVVVILNSISDSETINRRTHGFSRDGIPDAEDVVRIDVVGGFAIQKVNADRSYFRTIANMDIKLDFVPPSFINFVSRQLVGSGFKLYKKEVASVSKGDQKFCEALKDALYARVRGGFDSTWFQNEETQKRSTVDMVEDGIAEDDDTTSVVESEAANVISGEGNNLAKLGELKENNEQGSKMLDDFTLKSSNCWTDQNTCKEMFASCSSKEESSRSDETAENLINQMEKELPISPKVEKALETLENIISILQEQRSPIEKKQPVINDANFEIESVEESTPSEINQNDRNCAESSRIECPVVEPKSSAVQLPMIVENGDAKTGGGKSVNKTKNKKFRFCCLHSMFQCC